MTAKTIFQSFEFRRQESGDVAESGGDDWGSGGTGVFLNKGDVFLKDFPEIPTLNEEVPKDQERKQMRLATSKPVPSSDGLLGHSLLFGSKVIPFSKHLALFVIDPAPERLNSRPWRSFLC